MGPMGPHPGLQNYGGLRGPAPHNFLFRKVWLERGLMICSPFCKLTWAMHILQTLRGVNKGRHNHVHVSELNCTPEHGYANPYSKDKITE